MISLIFDIDSTLKSHIIFHLTSIKLLSIFIIICRSFYYNNSTYILLFMIIYIYSVGTKVDTITFVNQLDLFVLYNILLRKFIGITISNAIFIKEQVFN